MRTPLRIAALTAVALLPSIGTPAMAQGYDTAAGAASALGFTASPPIPMRRAPNVEAAPQDVTATGSIVRHTTRPSTHRRR